MLTETEARFMVDLPTPEARAHYSDYVERHRAEYGPHNVTSLVIDATVYAECLTRLPLTC